MIEFGRHLLRLRIAAVIALAGVMPGCGGGDGGGDVPTAPPSNRAPIITSATTANVIENSLDPFYRLMATDPDGDTLIYNIVGGADAARFALNGSELRIATTPANFERPSDVGEDNVFDVQLSVSDGRNTTMLSLAVTVTNSREGIAVRRVATGLVDPIAMAPVSDTVVLVAERRGGIYSVDTVSGTRALLYRITDTSPVGVTAIALDPTYATSGTFYVMYHNSSGALTLRRYVRNSAGPIVPDNFGPIFSIQAPNYAGGGWIQFDDSQTFLAATGDAGGSGDPTGSAQNDASMLGKIIEFRANPDASAGTTVSPWIHTIVAKGLHQPGGAASIAGFPVFSDQGDGVADEINIFFRSRNTNFGWPFKEGRQSVRGTPPANVTDPVIEVLRGAGGRPEALLVGGTGAPNGIQTISDQYVYSERGSIFTILARSLLPQQREGFVEQRDADFTPDVGALNDIVAMVTASNTKMYILDRDGELFLVEPG